jgi:hypothetical protein
MNKQAQAYYEGFFEAALDSGMSPSEATELTKQAADNSSFLGRYMASGLVSPSLRADSPYVPLEIKRKLDPSGKLQDERLFYTPDEIKKQRQLNYDMIPEQLKRRTAGGLLPNMLIGAGAGGLYAALRHSLVRSALGAQAPSDPAPGYAAAAGIGAGVGALSTALYKLITKHKQNNITPEDIKRMKIQQKDRGYASEFVPFRNVYDAINA